jgi:hypothetical protein
MAGEARCLAAGRDTAAASQLVESAANLLPYLEGPAEEELQQLVASVAATCS